MKRILITIVAAALVALAAAPALAAGPGTSGSDSGDRTQTREQIQLPGTCADCTQDQTQTRDRIQTQDCDIECIGTQTQVQTQTRTRVQDQTQLQSRVQSVTLDPAVNASAEPSGTAIFLRTATRARLLDGTGDGLPDMIQDRIGQPIDPEDVPDVSGTPEWVGSLTHQWNRFMSGLKNLLGME